METTIRDKFIVDLQKKVPLETNFLWNHWRHFHLHERIDKVSRVQSATKKSKASTTTAQNYMHQAKTCDRKIMGKVSRRSSISASSTSTNIKFTAKSQIQIFPYAQNRGKSKTHPPLKKIIVCFNLFAYIFTILILISQYKIYVLRKFKRIFLNFTT